MSPDIINALFEIVGAFAILISAHKCYKHKSAEGVSFVMTGFFFLWGLWNIYFYPSLDQVFSFYAGVVMVVCNLFYTALIIKYSFFKNKI